MIAERPIQVHVDNVVLPAVSSIGFESGVDAANGQAVFFIGDHWPMQQLRDTLAGSVSPLTAEVEAWQLWAVGEE